MGERARFPLLVLGGIALLAGLAGGLLLLGIPLPVSRSTLATHQGG